jgi:hypothetical protein
VCPWVSTARNQTMNWGGGWDLSSRFKPVNWNNIVHSIMKALEHFKS